MPNKFEIYTSDTEISIHLKMNGELFKNKMISGSVMLIILDIIFVYFAYGAYTNKDGVLTFFLLLLLLLYIIYTHYEHRKNKRWLEHSDETFLISKNRLIISKGCLNQNLLTIDIDTQKIINISYESWRGKGYPHYLPNCFEGNIHLHTYHGYYSFGINLDKEEAEEFIIELRSLIMQFQEPLYFIFVPLILDNIVVSRSL